MMWCDRSVNCHYAESSKRAAPLKPLAVHVFTATHIAATATSHHCLPQSKCVARDCVVVAADFQDGLRVFVRLANPFSQRGTVGRQRLPASANWGDAQGRPVSPQILELEEGHDQVRCVHAPQLPLAEAEEAEIPPDREAPVPQRKSPTPPNLSNTISHGFGGIRRSPGRTSEPDNFTTADTSAACRLRAEEDENEKGGGGGARGAR